MIIYNSHNSEKITKAIVYSYINLVPIIVMHESDRNKILKKAHELNMRIPRPKTIDEIKKHNYELILKEKS